jgi:hypothetical protein
MNADTRTLHGGAPSPPPAGRFTSLALAIHPCFYCGVAECNRERSCRIFHSFGLHSGFNIGKATSVPKQERDAREKGAQCPPALKQSVDRDPR